MTEENIKDKIKSVFTSDVLRIVERTDESADNFKESYHYKITIQNKHGKVSESFFYSVGKGHSPEANESKFFGLFSCLISDRHYSDYDEFLGLGYNSDSIKDNKIYKAICKQNDKAKNIGIFEFFDSLSEQEQELITDGL